MAIYFIPRMRYPLGRCYLIHRAPGSVLAGPMLLGPVAAFSFGQLRSGRSQPPRRVALETEELKCLTIGHGLLRQVGIGEQRERLQSGIRPVSERR